MRRRAGILLHPTSLPGPEGIGTLGADARRFLEFLRAARQSLWQILPLGPTGYGDSPYQSFSAFAGNPLLVALDELPGLDPGGPPPARVDGDPPARIDYGALVAAKPPLLDAAADAFLSGGAGAAQRQFRRFARRNSGWLDDFALFMALKSQHGGRTWSEWEPALARRDPPAIQRGLRDLAPVVERIKVQQFFFAAQWARLRREAHRLGIGVIGDMPIFVAYDSADVWANPGLFKLDADRRPTVVAGVPPDYFSKTGQLWGNPIYDWQRMRETGCRWWIDRVRRAFELTDIVRIDHFRGFAASWEVPAGAATAERGEWVPGPGQALFRAIEEELGRKAIIAEDLGVITPDVVELRRALRFPGMRVLQFAFDGGPDNGYLPHNCRPRSVVYTGTHDNDTTLGWFAALPHETRERVRDYLGHRADDIAWDLLRLAWQSVARNAVAPLQDVLRLGPEARMNIPGRPAGNWAWRFGWHQFPEGLAEHLGRLTALCARGR